METSFKEILESAKPRSEKIGLIADMIRKMRGYSWVGIYEVAKDDIKMVSCAGRTAPVIPSFPRDKGLNGRAVTQRKPVIVNDIDKDEDYLLTFTDTKSEIVVPVFDREHAQIVGTIDVEAEKTNAFSDDDVRFLESCAKSMAQVWSGAN
jgi:L-methionine (R)-S-oxide reductase